MINKCHCGHDHANDSPVNEKEVLEYNAKSIAEHIDNAIIEQIIATIYKISASAHSIICHTTENPQNIILRNR